MSADLRILIQGQLDENKSTQEMQKQLNKISNNLNLNLGVNVKEFQKIAKSVQDIQKQLGSSSIKLIDEKDIQGTKKFVTSIDEVKKQFKDIGSVKINKVFDPVTNELSKFNVEIQKADGLVEKLRYELAQLKGVHGITDGFMMTSKSEVDNTALKSEKALQQTIIARNAEQKRAAEEQAKAINRNIELEQKEIKTQQELTKELERKIGIYQKEKQLESQNLTRRYGKTIDQPALKNSLSEVMTVDPKSFNSMKEFRNWQEKVNLGFKEISSNANTAKSHSIGFGEAVTTAFQKFPVWMLTATAFFAPIRALQSMTQEIIAIDTAMVSLNRVTDMSQGELGSFLESSIKLSDELSSKLQDVLAISEEFARMGFKNDELLDLSKTAQVLQNISDLDAKQSVDTLTSAMLNFNIAAEDSLSISDALNEVDNNFAVSTKDLSDGIRKAASTSKTFGVEMSDLVGYIAAIGSTTRESGAIIGNGLKTVISRVTTLGEAETALKGVGVSIKDLSGSVRPVNDILGELAGKWTSLSDEQRQNIGVTVAGRYQLSRFLALMNNWNIATEASSTALNSQGSSMKEQEKYANSLEGRINRLQTAWDQFSVAVGNAVLTDTLIAGMEALTNLAKAGAFVSDKIGVLPILFASVGTAALVCSKNFRGFASSLVFLEAGTTRSAIALNVLKVSIRGLMVASVVGAVLMALGFALEKVISAISAHNEQQRQIKQDLDKSSESMRTQASSVDELVARYNELEEIKNSSQGLDNQQELEYNQITKELANLLPTVVTGLDAKGNAIIANKEQLASEIKLLKEKVQLEKEQALIKAPKKIKETTEDIKDLKTERSSNEKAINTMMSQKDTAKEQGKLAEWEENINKYRLKNIEIDQQINQKLRERTDIVAKILGSYANLTAKDKDHLANQVISKKISAQQADELAKSYDKVRAIVGDNLSTKHIKLLSDDQPKLFKEMSKAISSGNVDWDKYRKKLINSGIATKEVDNIIADLTGNKKDATAATEDLNAAESESADTANQAIITYDSLGKAIAYTGQSAEDMAKALKDAQGDYDALNLLIQNMVNNGNLEQAQATATKDAYEALADEIDPLNGLLESLAHGKQLSASEAMELINKEHELADAISVENGVVKINEKAVASLRDAKLKSYKDMMKSVKQGVVTESMAFLAKIKLYGAEVKAIQSVAEAKAKLNEGEDKLNDRIKNDSNIRSIGQLAEITDQRNQIQDFNKQLEDLDNLSKVASSGLEQVGTETEKLSDKTDDATDSTKESTKAKTAEEKAQDALNATLETYGDLLDVIEGKLTEVNALKNDYAEGSKEYRDAIDKEIALLQKKNDVLNSETQALSSMPTTYTGSSSGGSDVTRSSGVSGAQLNKHLDGKLSGLGDEIVAAAQASGLDPGFLAAIAMHESGRGKSNAIRTKNNAFGIMGSNGLRSFSSVGESIRYAADMLKRLYTSKGLTTVAEIQKKYAPSGAKNDPNGLNNNWVKGVTNFWNEFTGTVTSGMTSVAGKASKSVADYYYKNFRVTSHFGDQEKGLRSSPHKGMDFANGRQGDLVKAFTGGKVISATYSSTAGNWVVIQQDDGTVGKYMHMQKGLMVKAGDRVKAGQALGRVGNTGRSTGAHLHYGVEKNGKYIDPEKYIKNSGELDTSTYDISRDVDGNIRDNKGQIIANNEQIEQLIMDKVQSFIKEYDDKRNELQDDLARIDYKQSRVSEDSPEWAKLQAEKEAIMQKEKVIALDTIKYIKNQIKYNKDLNAAQKAALNEELISRTEEYYQLEQKILEEREKMADRIIDLYKQMYEKQKQIALDAIDKMLDEIDKKEAEKDYKESLRDEQKNKQEIMNELNSLSMDNSDAAKARKKELNDQLQEQNKSIDDMVDDHAREKRKANLEDQKTKVEAKYDDLINDEEKFAKMRSDIINGNTKQIAKDMGVFYKNIKANSKALGRAISNNLIELINQANAYLGNKKVKPVKPASLAVGGITPSWGSEGKWAVLHQDEMISTKHDTKNILKALDISKNLVKNLNLPKLNFNTMAPNLATNNSGGNSYNLTVNWNGTGNRNEAEQLLNKVYDGFKRMGGGSLS